MKYLLSILIYLLLTNSASGQILNPIKYSKYQKLNKNNEQPQDQLYYNFESNMEPPDSLYPYQPIINKKSAKLKKQSNLALTEFYPVQVVIDDKKIDTYTYDDNGNILSCLEVKLINNEWVNDCRYICTYDSKGNRIVQLNEYWGFNKWIGACRLSYTYDYNGNELVRLTEKWINNVWVNSERLTRTYNNAGNELTYLCEGYENNTWRNYTRITSIYKDNEQLLTYYVETWGNNGWQMFSRKTYTYDNDGYINNILFEQWSDNPWIDYFRYTYTYDNKKHVVNVLGQTSIGFNWENFKRGTYSYDNNGDLIAFCQEYWRDNYGWENTSRFTNTYNDHHNILVTLGYEWKNSSWENINRKTRTYNSNGNILTELFEYSNNNVWVYGSRQTNVYDFNENLLSQIIEEWQNNCHSKNYEKRYIYDNNGNAIFGEVIKLDSNTVILEEDGLTLRYNNKVNYLKYTATKVNIKYAQLTDVNGKNESLNKYSLSQNYPNPFNSSTIIKCTIPIKGVYSLKVYNVLGQEIAMLCNKEMQAGENTFYFDASKLPSGVYMYQLIGGSTNSPGGNINISKKMLLLK